MSLNNYVISLIRNVVPMLIGSLLTAAAVRWHFVLDQNTQVQAGAACVLVLSAGWYALVRLLEQKWPWFGVLIGYKAQPVYVTAPAAGLDVGQIQVAVRPSPHPRDTTPTTLRQPALDAVNALADTVDQDAVTIATLQQQLATAQNPPAPTPATQPFGVSLSPLAGETWAQAVARTEAALGPITVWRVYDAANGPTWLLNKLKGSGLLDGRHIIVASVKHEDAGMTGLIQAVDYLTIDHEPDQMYDKGGPRVTPAQLAPLLHDVRAKIDAAGRTGKCKLGIILTGTNYAERLAAYMAAIGDGVVEWAGVDPYASKGTAAGLVGPLLPVAAQYGLPVAVTEIGMKTATPAATVAAFVQSLAAIRGKVLFTTWFNQPGAAALGNRIDDDPDAADGWKAVTGATVG